jgi:transcriptional regulator with XRE-family HTH domain
VGFVEGRPEILRRVMLETGTTQSELSRLSGVHQPSISQYLAGKVDLSDDQLDRLLSCLGHRLEVVRRPVAVDLTRSERRSWRLHLRISSHLSPDVLDDWRPTLTQNLKVLRSRVQGQPHERNLKRWQMLVASRDLSGIRRALTGLDRDSIEMREISPFGGLLSPQERSDVLRRAG